jgi:hypothetical protein
MNSNQQSNNGRNNGGNIPAKGDLIINPSTSRPIKVGGRIWLKLVKEGLVSGHYTDPKKLGKLPDNEEEAEKEIERINKTLPRGKQSVRGRGIYKGQITTRNKTPDTEDVSRYTAQVASKVVNENIERLSDCDNIEAELEKLILQEMAIKKKVGRPKKSTAAVEQKYTLQEPEQYDEEEEVEEVTSGIEEVEEDDEDFFGDSGIDIDYFADE